jgi:hypothetical protein
VGAVAADFNGQKLRPRSVYNDASARDYATGQMQSSWTLRPETRIATAQRDWSKPLCETINPSGKYGAAELCQGQVARLGYGRLFRTYCVWKGSSFLENYWF